MSRIERHDQLEQLGLGHEERFHIEEDAFNLAEQRIDAERIIKRDLFAFVFGYDPEDKIAKSFQQTHEARLNEIRKRLQMQ